MNTGERNKFCLIVAEKAKEFLDDKEEKDLAESAIKKCWEWVDSRCDVAEELYHYLDNEENGFTVLQEYETDDQIIAAWDCIIDAIAYICKSAYLEAGAEYFPELIELVDNNTIKHMMESFSLCSGREDGL